MANILTRVHNWAMARRTPASGFVLLALAGMAAFLCFVHATSSAQQLAKRLILTDGSYQLATKWEVHGDRVRYFSAERGEWEEVPKSMVDWPATEKYEKDRANGAPPLGVADLEKELAQDRQADEAKTPQVAPGLRLPEDGGVLLFDTFENQPQLVEIQQSGGLINQNRKGNVLRAAINPVASAKEDIELPGLHAKVQAHNALPAVYVKLDSPDQSSNGPPEQPWDRFRIVRLQSKQDKRIVGDIKVAIYGKVSQQQKVVPTTTEKLNSNWVKVTPTNPLAPGEYAVVEMLGKEGINLYVWDFGANPSAPANAGIILPEASPAAPAPVPLPALQNKRP
jgi:hypothetical protein